MSEEHASHQSHGHHHEHHGRAASHATPTSGPGRPSLVAQGMAAIQRMIAAAPQAATLAAYENEQAMHEGLVMGAAGGRKILPHVLTDFASNMIGGHAAENDAKPKTAPVAKAFEAAPAEKATASPATAASAASTSAAPADNMRAFIDEETSDEHKDDWAKDGEVDPGRIGWRHKSKFRGAFKCNLFTGEGMRRDGDIEPGTDANGHVETPSVDEMVQQVNEVKETGALSGKTIQWFDIVEGGIAAAQPKDLVLIAAKDRRDHVKSNGHIGILTDLVYDSEAGRIERIRIAEASSSRGAVNENPGFAEAGRQRTTWGPAPGHNKEISGLYPEVLIIRPRKKPGAE